MTANLIELAEQVERLEGPCRETDLAIICAVGTHVLERRGKDKKEWLYPVEADTYGRIDPNPYSYGVYSLPRYTASLDAAMTLADDAALAELFDDAMAATGTNGWKTSQWREQFIRNFLAAALRARAAMDAGV